MNVVYYRMVNQGYGVGYPGYGSTTPAVTAAAPVTGSTCGTLSTLGGAGGLSATPGGLGSLSTGAGLGARLGTTPGLTAPNPAAKWILPGFSTTQIQYMVSTLTL